MRPAAYRALAHCPTWNFATRVARSRHVRSSVSKKNVAVFAGRPDPVRKDREKGLRVTSEISFGEPHSDAQRG